MKKTQTADLFSTIRGSVVPFVSIVVFIMLAVCFFLGIGWSGLAYDATIANVFENQKYYDFRLVTEDSLFPSGALKKLSELDGIEMEKSGMLFRVFDFRNDRCVAQLLMLPEKFSTCYNIEGKLPGKKDEIAVIRRWAENNGVRIGEKIDGYTVTAIVDNPEFMFRAEKFQGVTPNLSAPVSAVFYVPEETVTVFGSTLSNSVQLRFEGLRQYDYSADKYNQLSDLYEQKINDICSPYGIAIFSRRAGFIQSLRYEFISTLFSRMRIALAVPFLVTSFLICYTIVKRLVTQNARLVGTRKALGFTDAEIMKIYLAYAGFASVAGIISGIVLARTVVEPVILNVMQDTFAFGEIIYHVSFPEIIPVAAGVFALTEFFAFLSVRKTLKKSTLSLLSEETLSSAKVRRYEKGKIWKRISLFGKTVINNIFNDRLRVVSMLVGIIGCSLFLFCGLNLTFNINNSLDVQFDKLQSFNALVYFDYSKSGSEQKISDILDSEGAPYSPVFVDVGMLHKETGENGSYAWLFTSPDGNFSGLRTLSDESGVQSIQDEVRVSEGFFEAMDVESGDFCSFASFSCGRNDFPVSGSFEHHLCEAQIVMTDSAYEKYTGSAPVHNAFAVCLDRGVTDDFTSALKDCDGYICTEDYYANNAEAFGIFSSLCTAASIVFVVISFVMVFVVINNLLAMYIAEKKKEITVLLINGYSPEKAKQYVCLDTVLLGIVGFACGTALGYMLCYLTLEALTTVATSFVSGFSGQMFAVSAAAFGAMFVSVTVMALKKIDRFDLTDITK